MTSTEPSREEVPPPKSVGERPTAHDAEAAAAAVELPLLNQQGVEVGRVHLPGQVFGIRPSKEFLHEAVTKHRANQRRWTANTKTRSEVSGGGRKPWKQKHTGRARAGSIRSPLWRKGGVAFGPRAVDPACKRLRLPRRKARLALLHALSVRASAGGICVLQAMGLDGAKTKQVAQILKNLGGAKRPLLVVDQHDKNLIVASRNLAHVRVMLAAHLNAYEVLLCDQMIVTRTALEKLGSRWN